jgi:DNA transformation protein
MSVSPSFRTLVLDQLGRVLPSVRGKGMFGGVGLYAGELFFALIADDVVYLKADEQTRPAFEARGMGPFRPHGPDGPPMQYYQLPEELLEDAEALRGWVDDAVGVARRSKRKRA